MSNKSSKAKPSDNGSVAVLEQPVGVAVLDVPAADESAVVISEGIEQLDSLSDLATLINDSPPAKALDAATQVENSIESFEQAFKGDPLATKYKAFGEEGKRLYDPADMAAEYVHLGAMGYNLMIDEKNVRPAAYDRARTVKKLESRPSSVRRARIVLQAPRNPRDLLGRAARPVHHAAERGRNANVYGRYQRRLVRWQHLHESVAALSRT